jgi:hypothetical protein
VVMAAIAKTGLRRSVRMAKVRSLKSIVGGQRYYSPPAARQKLLAKTLCPVTAVPSFVDATMLAPYEMLLLTMYF